MSSIKICVWEAQIIIILLDCTGAEQHDREHSFGQDHECVQLSLPAESRLLMIIFPDRDWRKNAFARSIATFQVSKAILIYFSKHAISTKATTTHVTFQ